MGVVFLDLDRTLLRHASGPVLNAALVAEGVVDEGRALPGQGLLYSLYDRFGENVVSMGLARATARVARGWRQEDVRRAAKRAVEGLGGLLQPFAPQRLAEFRRDGHELVLATTTPVDMIEAFAESLGLDGVIAPRYEVRDGRYTGRLDGGFVWGLGKLRAARRWAASSGVDLRHCVACSDSVYDLPLLATWATRVPSIRIPGCWRWPRRGGGRSSTGTVLPACRPSWASSPTTCSAPWCTRRAFPTPASTSAASSTYRQGGR